MGARTTGVALSTRNGCPFGREHCFARSRKSSHRSVALMLGIWEARVRCRGRSLLRLPKQGGHHAPTRRPVPPRAAPVSRRDRTIASTLGASPRRTSAMATTGCGRVSTARALSCKQFVDPAPAARFGSCRLAPCCGDGWRCLRRGLPVTDTASWCAREEPDSAGEGWAGGNHGFWPLVDRVDDLGIVDPGRYTEVIPRSARPSWRCMTSSGIPSRDISTA